jgi:hypothetical protein
MNPINKAQAESLARTILKMLGASLVTNGAIQHVTWNVIIGAGMALGGAVWSWFEHSLPQKPEAKPGP